MTAPTARPVSHFLCSKTSGRPFVPRSFMDKLGWLRAGASWPRSDPKHPSDPLHPNTIFVCGAGPLRSGGRQLRRKGVRMIRMPLISRIAPGPTHQGTATSRDYRSELRRNALNWLPEAFHKEKRDPNPVAGRFNALGANPRNPSNRFRIRVRSCRCRIGRDACYASSLSSVMGKSRMRFPVA